MEAIRSTLMRVHLRQVGTQSPLILCAAACNLLIILQNLYKFFALLIPLPFFLQSEMWSSHSPDCFYVSFTKGYIACYLFISHAAVYTVFLFLAPFCPSLFLSFPPGFLLPDTCNHIFSPKWSECTGYICLVLLNASRALILLHVEQGSPQHLASTISPDPGTGTAVAVCWRHW